MRFVLQNCCAIPIRFSVLETVVVNTKLGQMIAEDADTVSQSAPPTYSIIG